MPKLTLSLSSDVLKTLERLGKSPYDIGKEIIVRFAERIAKVSERGNLLASMVNTVDELIDSASEKLRKGQYKVAAIEIVSALRVLEAILTELLMLPLSEGERMYAELLRGMCRSYLKRSRVFVQGEPLIVVSAAATAIMSILLAVSWIKTLLLELGVELERVGKPEEALRIYEKLSSTIIEEVKK